MKILLDQSTPVKLRRYLVGHEVKHTAELGWEEISNGKLLRLAEDNDFALLITADKNIPHQQNLSGRKISILGLSTNNWPTMIPYTASIVEAVNPIQPGELVHVFCGVFVPTKHR